VSFGPGEETVAGLAFGLSRDGSQCSMKTRTHPARIRPSPHRLRRRNIPRASNTIRHKPLRLLQFFTPWLIAVSSRIGQSNGASSGAGAPIRWKKVGCPGGMRKHRPLWKSGTKFATILLDNRSSRRLPRAPSETDRDRKAAVRPEHSPGRVRISVTFALSPWAFGRRSKLFRTTRRSSLSKRAALHPLFSGTPPTQSL
jgi:hypothetical protein